MNHPVILLLTKLLILNSKEEEEEDMTERDMCSMCSRPGLWTFQINFIFSQIALTTIRII